MAPTEAGAHTQSLILSLSLRSQAARANCEKIKKSLVAAADFLIRA
jgi:hypothetical protein